MLTQFIRDKNRKPIGCVVAIQQEDGDIALGVSLCGPNDKWNRDLGRKIAIGRAYQNGVMPEIPVKKQQAVYRTMGAVLARAARHFDFS